MSSTEFYERIRFKGHPTAHPDATVVCGNARFTVLTERLVRLEWSETGHFEDRATYAFPTRYKAPLPVLKVSETGGTLTIETSALTLRYIPTPVPFNEDNLSITLNLNGRPVIWTPGTPNPQNLRGTRRTLDGCEGDASLEEGLLSRAGWALFDDSRNVLFGDDGWVCARPDFALQDWYFFGYSHDYKAAIAEYTRFGGRVPLIPRYILGGWWSRYWAYSEQDLRDLVAEFETHNVPLDVFVIDMDWHTPDGWTGYTWNRELFPDPPAFLKWLHGKGMRVTLNLHPADGVHPHEDIYPDFARAMGIDPDGKQPVPFHIAGKDYVEHYFKMLHHPMEDEGVDFWWMDWQQGEISEVKGLDPLPWINHLHFNDITRHTDNWGHPLRPMLYSRWGGLGNHRYYIGFSGDTFVRWTALQFQPHFTTTAANVGYGWWSHDIGGHMGGATEAELYTRWVQFGALSPVLRVHSTKDPRAERRPWAYPQPYADAAMAAFRLRYKLIPYLYTMARLNSDTGLALCRPMYYEHPESDAAYVARYQYYLGTKILAAPIVFPCDPATGMAYTDVWIPEGTWIAWDSLETFEGARWIRLWGDQARIPMLVRAGTILPLAAEFASPDETHLRSGTVDTLPQDQMELAVFPGTGSFRLYEDDGLTDRYIQGQYEWTTLHTCQPDLQTWSVSINPVEGHCEALPGKRGYTVSLRGCALPNYVTLNGATDVEWAYDKGHLTLNVIVPTQPKSQPVTLTVSAQGTIVALDAAHDWQLALSEIECLIGETCSLETPAPDELLAWEALNAARSGAFAHAVARMGGPFATFREYGAPEEATQHLGHVILAAPAGNEPYDAHVALARHRGGQVDTHTAHFAGTTTSHVIATPFGAESAETTFWEAKVSLKWRDAEIRTTFHSAPLFPAIPYWQATIYDRDEAQLAPDDILDHQGRRNPALAWQIFEHDVAHTHSFQRAYFAPLMDGQWEALAKGRPMAAYLVAGVISPNARDAVIEFAASDEVSLYVNGQPVAEDTEAADNSTSGRFVHGTRKTVKLRLRAGKNTLLVHCLPGRQYPPWIFGCAFVTPEGDLIDDLKTVRNGQDTSKGIGSFRPSTKN